MMEENLKFIAGDFLKNVLSDDKLFLYHYFKTKTQKRFIIYYEIFQNIRWFSNHTGVVCDYRQLVLLERRYKKIEQYLKLAKEKYDSKTIAIIKSGKFKL